MWRPTLAAENQVLLALCLVVQCSCSVAEQLLLLGVEVDSWCESVNFLVIIIAQNLKVCCFVNSLSFLWFQATTRVSVYCACLETLFSFFGKKKVYLYHSSLLTWQWPDMLAIFTLELKSLANTVPYSIFGDDAMMASQSYSMPMAQYCLWNMQKFTQKNTVMHF